MRVRSRLNCEGAERWRRTCATIGSSENYDKIDDADEVGGLAQVKSARMAPSGKDPRPCCITTMPVPAHHRSPAGNSSFRRRMVSPQNPEQTLLISEGKWGAGHPLACQQHEPHSFVSARLSLPKAPMGKKIKKAPGWLGLSEDRTSFVYIPERADIVREIFELSIAGMGGYTIANLLNSRNVPAFGTSNRWDQSTIHNMLINRATVGEYQRKQTIDGKECPVGDPVVGYYPPVIDESLFQAAQAARQRNLATGRGRKGQLITNLFAGLPECSYCGSPVKFHSNGNAKSLICAAVLDRGTCFRFGWSYRDFENSFFDFLNKNNVLPKFSQKLAELRTYLPDGSPSEIRNARAEIVQIVKANVSKLVVASAGASPPDRKSSAVIRRNHPARFFTVVISDQSLTGYPAVASRETSSPKFSRSRNISPHQPTARRDHGFPRGRGNADQYCGKAGNDPRNCALALAGDF